MFCRWFHRRWPTLSTIEKNADTKNTVILPGKGKTAVVIVHGFSDTPQSLMPLAEHLNGTLGIECILPLLEGHGATIDDFEHARHTRWIAQVEETYENAIKRFEHVFLIGFSMGGLLVTVVDAPQCAGRVLIAPAFDVGVNRQFKLLVVPFIKFFKRYSYKNPEHNTLNRNLYDPEMREKFRLYYDREPLTAIEEYGKVRKKALQRLQEIHGDAVVILSKTDRVVDFERTKAIITAKQPSWPVVELSRSGHMIPLDYEREIVFATATDFIKKGCKVDES